MGIRINIVFWVLSLICGCAALFLMFTFDHRVREIDREYLDNLQSLKLSTALRRSSDDLTRFARAYAATGDPEYRRRFQAVLDIRDGRIARPVGYDKSYWDLEIAGVVFESEAEEAVSLRQMMVDTGLDSESLSDLSESEILSEGLAKIEEDAFKLVEQGNYEGAVLLLFGRDYHHAKSQIMVPINRVDTRIEQKGEAELQRLLDRYRGSRSAIIAFVLGSVIFGALAGLYRRYPLQRYLSNDAEESVRSEPPV